MNDYHWQSYEINNGNAPDDPLNNKRSYQPLLITLNKKIETPQRRLYFVIQLGIWLEHNNLLGLVASLHVVDAGFEFHVEVLDALVGLHQLANSVEDVDVRLVVE